MGVIIEWLQTGINVVLDSAMLIAIIPIMSVVLMWNSTSAHQQQTNALMQNYTEYNQYDMTHVYPQDVTAAILSYRGFPAVKVQLNNGTFAVWSTGAKATDFKAASINTVISQNTLYDSDIERNANGEVVSVIFKQCAGTCGRS